MSNDFKKGAETAAPVFSFSFPLGTEYVELPSQGRFYPEEHPLFGIKLVEIKYMCGKDEEILTNKSYIKNGLVVDKLLTNLIVDKHIVNALDEMLSADKAAIFIAARVTGISSVYDAEVVCPQCSVRQTYTFDLEKRTLYHGLEKDIDGVKRIENNIYRVTLPVSKIEVDVRLSISKDSNKMLKLVQSNKEIVNNDIFGDSVISITIPDGTRFTDSKSKLLFFENVPAKELLFLKRKIKEINPDFSLEQEFSCTKCPYVGKLEPPFTANFIYPK